MVGIDEEQIAELQYMSSEARRIALQADARITSGLDELKGLMNSGDKENRLLFEAI